jgi:hypothetical protein
VPIAMTTTANAIKNQKDAPLAGFVGEVAAVAGALAVSGELLAVSAGVAAPDRISYCAFFLAAR